MGTSLIASPIPLILPTQLSLALSISLFQVLVPSGLLRGATPTRGADLDRTVSFSIAAQPLESALVEFSHQAQIQVVIAPNAVNMTQIPALTGKVPARVALDVLLRNSGLKYAAIGKSISV